MNLLQWAIDPWGKIVPIHIAWFLVWVAVIAGLLFVIVHAIYVRYFAKPRQFARDPVPVDPQRFPRRFPVIRWLRGRFTGSWQPPCSHCYLQPSESGCPV